MNWEKGLGHLPCLIHTAAWCWSQSLLLFEKSFTDACSSVLCEITKTQFGTLNLFPHERKAPKPQYLKGSG